MAPAHNDARDSTRNASRPTTHPAMTRFTGLPTAAAPLDREAQDLRELEGYVPTGSAADQQAAAWLLRRQRGLAPGQAGEFQAWLDADPANRAAFGRQQATWQVLDDLPADAVTALKARLDTPPAVPRGMARRHWFASLVPQAAMAMAAIMVAGGAWLGWERWQQQPTFTQTYATARGEQLRIDLPDGSLLQLDAATRADVTLYRQRREVRLAGGQAMFSVQADAARPFDVLAGPLRVTVVGTRFAVRRLPAEPGGVHVAVEEGRVRVASLEGASAPVLLTAGQAIASDAGGMLGRAAFVAAAGVAPWREGRVAFEGMPLAQALAEFERYGDTRLRIGDPEVAALHVTGSFDVRKADNFAQVLTRVLPVRLERRDGVTFIEPAR